MIREINAIKILLFANVLIIQIAKIVQRDHSAIQMIMFVLTVYLIMIALVTKPVRIKNVLNVFLMIIARIKIKHFVTWKAIYVLNAWKIRTVKLI